MIVTTFSEFEVEDKIYKVKNPTEDDFQPFIDFFRQYSKRLGNSGGAADNIPDVKEIAAARAAVEPLLVDRPAGMIGTLADSLVLFQIAISLYSESIAVPEIKKK